MDYNFITILLYTLYWRKYVSKVVYDDTRCNSNRSRCRTSVDCEVVCSEILLSFNLSFIRFCLAHILLLWESTTLNYQAKQPKLWLTDFLEFSLQCFNLVKKNANWIHVTIKYLKNRFNLGEHNQCCCFETSYRKFWQ